MIPIPPPGLPLGGLVFDLMEDNGDNFLALRNNYSKWISVDKMSSTTFDTIMEKVTGNFCMRVIPTPIGVRTENEPHFIFGSVAIILGK